MEEKKDEGKDKKVKWIKRESEKQKMEKIDRRKE